MCRWAESRGKGWGRILRVEFDGWRSEVRQMCVWVLKLGLNWQVCVVCLRAIVARFCNSKSHSLWWVGRSYRVKLPEHCAHFGRGEFVGVVRIASVQFMLLQFRLVLQIPFNLWTKN